MSSIAIIATPERIRSIPEGWIESSLEEIALINPRESIRKGEVKINVPMACIDAFSKKINSFDKKEFKGGTKFRNGDTLLARITPCLENGKTAYVDILEDGEVGFGSTEYIVIREKENKSDKHFLFYLSISPYFRELAIKAMTGTSGRQRVQTDALVNKTLYFPPLSEQKAIAQVLTAFDDKIENLRAQNETLEQLAQTIFKEWFGKYQVGDKLPEGWHLRSFYSLGDFINGSAFKSTDFSQNKEGLPIIKIAELKNGITESTAFTGKDVDSKYLINNMDILFSWSGSPETSIDIFLWSNNKAILNQHTFNVKVEDDKLKAWSYFLLRYYKPLFIQLAKMKQTTGLGHVTISNLKEYKFVYPPKFILEEKTDLFTMFYRKLYSNSKQIQSLTKTRDTLLPKLMRGEIRVNNVNS